MVDDGVRAAEETAARRAHEQARAVGVHRDGGDITGVVGNFGLEVDPRPRVGQCFGVVEFPNRGAGRDINDQHPARDRGVQGVAVRTGAERRHDLVLAHADMAEIGQGETVDEVDAVVGRHEHARQIVGHNRRVGMSAQGYLLDDPLLVGIDDLPRRIEQRPDHVQHLPAHVAREGIAALVGDGERLALDEFVAILGREDDLRRAQEHVSGHVDVERRGGGARAGPHVAEGLDLRVASAKPEDDLGCQRIESVRL